MGWTREQEKAINARNANILVSAGAGSGKTSVLVERIIKKIIKDKVNIENILVVTFTEAAASEMKERVLKALYKELDNNPDDVNIQRQVSFLGKSNISTIHSFCLNVIRNHFYELGISANVKIGDTNEIELMKAEVLEKIFEDKYENGDSDFQRLIELYTTYKTDDDLKDLVLKIYEFIMCMPRPKEWLENAVEEYNVDLDSDFNNSKWAKILAQDLDENRNYYLVSLKNEIDKLSIFPSLEKCHNILVEDYNDLAELDFNDWDGTVEKLQSKEYSRWPSLRSLLEEEKEINENAKLIRDSVKDFVKTLKDTIFFEESKDILLDEKEMYPVLKALQGIVFEFEKEFTKAKTDKNLIDFNDIEHLAYKLLVDENGNKTQIAEDYDFNEILIDEYQDSNLLQEEILKSVSNGHNTFMVGDVKQSIYRFREARPDLFINKYEKYKKCNLDESDELTEDTKILLYNNFRSRESVLDFTNLIFDNIMSKELGEIEYNEEEYLNKSGSFEDTNKDLTTEINIVDTDLSDIENEEELPEELKSIRTIELEARLTGIKIKELINEGYKFKDICILLRSGKRDAATYERELSNQGIPVFSEMEGNFLESIEMITMIAMLKIIDNPIDDINLLTVLRSPIGGFNDNELIELRLLDRNSSFYECLKKSDSPKVISFLEQVNYFREEEKKIPLDELIWKIFMQTGYYYYVGTMPGGRLRQANLIKLFEKAKVYEKSSFKGLFNFIQFIGKVTNSNAKIEGAKLIGEKDDVVRLMTIHHSKGLEFPVVILSSLSKARNRTDSNYKIVLDQELGIGVNYINELSNYDTIMKKAILTKQNKESISEEMRILYVALTRAKDKLVLIGNDKNAYQTLENKKNNLKKYNNKDKIEVSLIQNSQKMYKDWIDYVYLKENSKYMKYNIYNKSELGETKKEENIEEPNPISNYKNMRMDENKLEEIDKILNYKYPFESSIELPSKTSVTAIKEQYNNRKDSKNEDETTLIDQMREENVTGEKIKYNGLKEFSLEESTKFTGAKRGTLIHTVLQQISQDANVKKINDYIEVIGATKEEKEYLHSQKYIFDRFIKSELYAELEKAKEIHTENPFFMDMPYEETQDKVLVQGVIDLFFIDKDDRLILVDYKTDNVNSREELISRYEIQLKIYKDALERSLNRKVDSVCIYSTKFNEMINLFI